NLARVNPLTAVCFILLSVALCSLWWEQQNGPPWILGIGRTLAWLVLGVGLGKVLSELFNLDFALDQLLFQQRLAEIAAARPNRMAPNTAVNFVIAGLGLLLLDVRAHRRWRVVQGLGLLLAFESLLALLGYTFRAHFLYGLSPVT